MLYWQRSYFYNPYTLCQVELVSQSLYHSNLPLWKGFYSLQTPSNHSESFRHLKQHIAILVRVQGREEMA